MILYISLEKISTRKFIAMASKKIPLSKKPRAQPKTQTRGMKKSMQGGGISLTMTQVKEAIALLKDAGTFNTFSYKTPDFELEIELRKDSASSLSPHIPAAAPPITPAQQVITAAPTLDPIIMHKQGRPQSAFEILSPMVGTFYRRPNPDSPPFVEVGDLVEADTPVCIVEVMKLLNTISAARKGRVAEICVADGGTIEADQVLMVIELV